MNRDEEFSKFYSENYEIVFRYVYSMLGESFISEDIVQDTFLEAWRRFDIIRSHPNRVGWLMRTACYKMRNISRREKRRETIPYDENLEEAAKEDSGYVERELELFLEKTLNEEERTRFRRYFLWGYTVEEMSDLEGVTKNNIRVRICRLMNKVKEKILAVCFMALMLGNIIVVILQRLT